MLIFWSGLANQEEPMKIIGTERPETLVGTDGDDLIRGKASRDTLIATGGRDVLFGGDGGDLFMFSDAAAKCTTIKDFEPGEDLLLVRLVNYFDDVPGGTPGWTFTEGGKGGATGSLTNVIYNPNNGKLFVDIDGAGSEAALKIAKLMPDLDVGKSDFFLYFN